MPTVVVGQDDGDPVHMVWTEAGDPQSDLHILLLHGLFDNRHSWSRLMPHLAEAGYHVIAPDLVGFGHSSRPLLHQSHPSERYSVDAQVAWVRAFIAHLALDNIVIVGNSLGGGVALRALCTPWPQAPDNQTQKRAPKIRALVLEAAAGHLQQLPVYVQLLAQWPGRLLLWPWLLRLCLRTGLARRLARRTFAQAFHDTSKIPADLVDVAVEVLQRPNTLYAYRESARNLIPADMDSFPERYRDIDIPTLILWGQQDRIVPPLFALLFEAEIPTSKLHLFDECGHAPHLELPIETAVAMRDWMRRYIVEEQDI